jgi:nucleotide-binding universal stress UspA family protein
MRRVLVCVDFSASTEKVVAFALEITRSTEAELYFLHVVPPEPDFVGYGTGPDSVRDSVAKTFRDVHVSLQELARVAGNGHTKITPLTIQGVAVDKIVEQAEKLGVDAIVLGSHGHGAVYDLFIGSVTKGVLGHAPIPVVVVPGPK